MARIVCSAALLLCIALVVLCLIDGTRSASFTKKKKSTSVPKASPASDSERLQSLSPKSMPGQHQQKIRPGSVAHRDDTSLNLRQVLASRDEVTPGTESAKQTSNACLGFVTPWNNKG